MLARTRDADPNALLGLSIRSIRCGIAIPAPGFLILLLMEGYTPIQLAQDLRLHSLQLNCYPCYQLSLKKDTDSPEITIYQF